MQGYPRGLNTVERAGFKWASGGRYRHPGQTMTAASKGNYILDYSTVLMYHLGMEITAMTNGIKMHLWVSNMDAVGLDFDGTEQYLDAASAKDIMSRHEGVTLDGQTISGTDPEAIWTAFRDLRAAVKEAGHGIVDFEEGEELADPKLVASLLGSKDSARSLEELISGRAKTWEEFRTEALVTDEYIAELMGA